MTRAREADPSRQSSIWAILSIGLDDLEIIMRDMSGTSLVEIESVDVLHVGP